MNTITKIHRNKKGINPIIILLALLIVIIASGTIIFIWMNIEERAGHIIQIQNVKFDETQTKIFVQNTGKGDVIINLVIIDSTESIEINSQNCRVNAQQTNAVKQTQTAEITLNKSYKTEIHIKIVCNDGTYNATDWKP
jgi:flagellar basal body-associated protein FliL